MAKVPPTNIEDTTNIQKIVGTTNIKQKIHHIVKITKRTKMIGKKITDNIISKITETKVIYAKGVRAGRNSPIVSLRIRN